MDILVSFFLLIISSIIGIIIAFILNMKSYLKIAVLVMCIFIPIELYNDIYANNKLNKKPILNQQLISNLQLNEKPIPNSQPNVNPTDQTNTTKYELINTTPTSKYEIDKPPFDGLEPNELLTRLNYIYYATSNPREPLSYLKYKTHSDKLLESDNTKLSTNDTKLLKYTEKYYPQLNENQIDTKDCLNYGSGKGSCFQNPSLFFNMENKFNILTKGVNQDNANLIIREDFSMPMKIEPNNRYEKPLFINAPGDNLDKPLDQQSNETIKLSTHNSMCRHCKLAVCADDYCSLQNNLFM